MAAIIGLERKQVHDLCKKVAEIGIVAPAAYNSPGQVVIAGEIRPLTEVVAQAKANGAISATMLPVSGPFHSPLMQPAAQGLKDRILEAKFRKSKVDVICNVDALPHRDPTELGHNLIAQLTLPVRWQDTIEYLNKNQVKHYVEMGPGRVLTSLCRRINRSISCVNVQDTNSLEKSLGYFRSNTDLEVGSVVD